MIMPSMRMSMMMMACSKHANEVDRQADGADDEELTRVHLRRVEQSLNRFEDDEDRNEAEEQAVCKARKRFDAGVPGGEVSGSCEMWEARRTRR